MTPIEKNGMPSVLMAEKAVLSAMMHKPQTFIGRAAAEGVDAECFYLRKELHGAILREYKANPQTKEMEVVSFVTKLQLDQALDRCGGPSEIADVWGYTYERFDDWNVWVSQLREAKARRLAFMSSQRLAEAETSEDAIQETKATLEALMKAISGKGQSKSGKECCADFVAQWKADFESSEAIPGMATGYDEIDSISGGMRPGSLWIVCAKSTRGKSVMMLEIASQAIRDGKTVAIFTLEMTKAEVTGRLITVLAGMNYGPIVQPKESNKHDRSAMVRGITAVSESKVWIDDTPKLTMDQIENECQRIKDTTGNLDLIVIDYMQIVGGERQRGESREQEVARISMTGKQMAKKFMVPVLSASQLNAQGETRESRSLEQDADTLLFIADDGVKIGKMRNGKRDQILKLYMHGDKQRFLDYAPAQ